jgi:hypothetical protein
MPIAMNTPTQIHDPVTIDMATPMAIETMSGVDLFNLRP